MIFGANKTVSKKLFLKISEEVSMSTLHLIKCLYTLNSLRSIMYVLNTTGFRIESSGFHVKFL